MAWADVFMENPATCTGHNSRAPKVLPGHSIWTWDQLGAWSSQRGLYLIGCYLGADQVGLPGFKEASSEPRRAETYMDYKFHFGVLEQPVMMRPSSSCKGKLAAVQLWRGSINQSKRKTSNANGQTNLGHKHKAPDHNHEATQPMVDLPHTS